MINIVLCGGSGTRLWPLSRKMLPKQFVRMFDGNSLFQETILRNTSVCKEFLIVSNQDQYFLAVDQYQQVCHAKTEYLLEPVGRNTAPAIALACMTLDVDDLVFVTPSDHVVKKTSAYQSVVDQAKQLAEAGNLVTFGIVPGYPETGFGYIEANGIEVLSFKEKPNLETAESYVSSGNYYWNSGMFCFKAGVFLEELKNHSPAIYNACDKAFQKMTTHDCTGYMQVDMELMMQIPEDSIDYAVMEKSDKVKVVPSDIGWSDLGSFDAIHDEFDDKSADNVTVVRNASSKPPIYIDSKDNLVMPRNRQIALVDVEDMVVVDTSDAILVCKKGSTQKVKQVVEEIKRTTPDLAEMHNVSHRPWGTYEVLLESEKYKIKRIVVKPGGRLSLQKHFHRNEHWIVVSGTATVTVEDETRLVRPNESTYINMGQLHRLENDGKIDLVMIEVQVGEYTGEDDIVRIEDIYGR